MSIYVDEHAFNAFLDNASFEICCLSSAIGLDLGTTVLYHEHAVSVIRIGNGKSCLAKIVKEHLLCVAVVLECTVVIEMISGEIGE